MKYTKYLAIAIAALACTIANAKENVTQTIGDAISTDTLCCASAKANACCSELKDEADTMCYAIGMSMGEQIKPYAVQMDVDPAYLDEVVKGFEDGANIDNDAKRKAYLFGIFVAYQSMEGNGEQSGIREGLQQEIYSDDSTKSINLVCVLEGFRSAALNKESKLNKDSVQSILQNVSERIQTRKMEKLYGPWKKQNDDFNKKLAADKSLKSLGDGIYYKVEKEGAGKVATDDDEVIVNYEGKLIDDSVFDSSNNVTLPIAQLIPGMQKALTHMPVGSKWIVYIPSDQGYGAQEMGDKLKPFSTLKFTIEVLDIQHQ